MHRLPTPILNFSVLEPNWWVPISAQQGSESGLFRLLFFFYFSDKRMDSLHQMTDNCAYDPLPQAPPLPKRNAPGNVLFGVGRGLAGKFFAVHKG